MARWLKRYGTMLKKRDGLMAKARWYDDESTMARW
jgi:hypothetical protein